MEQTSLIVVGELNTDIIVIGLQHFPKPGELVNGTELVIGPGGKSRNIAAMAGSLMPKGSVVMVSKTVRDKFGLWKVPMEALQEVGVSTEYIKILDGKDTNKLPGVALIAVDRQGNNQIIGAPGITLDLNETDIDDAAELFRIVGENKGFLVFIGNCPRETAKYAAQLAHKTGVKILFDPGGTEDFNSLKSLLEGMYLIKPNEHEAKMLTGVEVKDFDSAQKAANEFMKMGVENVLITAGAQGAYLCTSTVNKHFPIPNISVSEAKDETGCGDQTMAALCAALLNGEVLQTAVQDAILAGTLQFHKVGIQPIGTDELEQAKQQLKT